jgi:branched-chain amino acid transport system permease protein
MTNARPFIVGLLSLCLALGVLPLFISSRYVLDLAITFCVWAGVVSQWNLVMGQAGIFSLVQVAIFSLGGYFTAVMGVHFGIPPLVTIVPAGVFCALFGLLIGLPCLRLRKAYVALLTLAAHYVVYLLIYADNSGLTGGSYGLYGFGDFGFRALLSARYEILGSFYSAIVIFFVLVLVAYLISRSPLGLAFRALRDSEVYASARGISRYHYQLLVFTITSFFIGIAGSFYGTHLKLVDPTGFEFGTVMTMLAMMVIGGQGHRWGPLLGCALVLTTNEVMRSLPEWRPIVVASITIAVLLVWPLGIATALDKMAAYIRRPVGRKVHLQATPVEPSGVLRRSSPSR